LRSVRVLHRSTKDLTTRAGGALPTAAMARAAGTTLRASVALPLSAMGYGRPWSWPVGYEAVFNRGTRRRTIDTHRRQSQERHGKCDTKVLHHHGSPFEAVTHAVDTERQPQGMHLAVLGAGGVS
jgi:hypothetical protein